MIYQKVKNTNERGTSRAEVIEPVQCVCVCLYFSALPAAVQIWVQSRSWHQFQLHRTRSVSMCVSVHWGKRTWARGLYIMERDRCVSTQAFFLLYNHCKINLGYYISYFLDLIFSWCIKYNGKYISKYSEYYRAHTVIHELGALWVIFFVQSHYDVALQSRILLGFQSLEVRL